MKTLKWIDSFFNTFEKRLAALSVLLGLFWLWQTIWLLLCMGSLVRVQSYDALFAFMADLKGFSSSLLISALIRLISAGTVNLQSIASALLSIRLLDWIMIILSLTAANTLGKTMRRILAAGLAALLLSVCFALFKGFSASSLLQVIFALRLMAGVLILLCLAAIALLGWMLFKNIYFLLKQERVK